MSPELRRGRNIHPPLGLRAQGPVYNQARPLGRRAQGALPNNMAVNDVIF